MKAAKVRALLQSGVDAISNDRVASQDEQEQLDKEHKEALEELEELERFANSHGATR